MNTRPDDSLMEGGDEELKEREHPKVSYICGGKLIFTSLLNYTYLKTIWYKHDSV